MTITNRYFTIGQINLRLKSFSDFDKIGVFEKALDIMSVNHSLTKEECVAKAMGYSKTGSGSEFFEKQN
jgi:hypothetical protein